MRIKTILGFGLLLIILSGCTSMMYPEKTSSDDCLIILPTEFLNPISIKPARSYFLELTGQEKKIMVSSKRYSNLYLKTTGENDMIETITSRVTNPDYRGDNSVHKVEIKLPYSKGGIVVSDFKIVQKIEQDAHYSFTSSYDFVELTEEEKQSIIDSAMENENLFPWFE